MVLMTRVCAETAKKAVTYHIGILERPYLQLNILRRFFFPYLLSLRLKKLLERDGNSPLQGALRIICNFFRFICLPLLSIGTLCQKKSGSGIVKRLICPEALPDNDNRGNPSCYGECSKNQLCPMCYNDKGELRRMYRNLEMECRDSADGWHSDDVISYTSYSDKKGADTSHMSLLYQHHVHPTAFVNYFNKIAVEYTKHLSKLIRQKNCQKQQERNILPHILIVDIDFSQNFIYTDRKSAIQSDHWTSTSVTIFVAVVRYMSFKSWSSPPLGLLKGQPVSVRQGTDDGGGDVYIYGEVSDNQVSESSNININIHNTHTIVSIPCEDIRVRNVVSVPLIVVSDSKKHDTHFVRHFLRNILLGPSGWLTTQTRESGLSERVRRIDIDSDGAASHFKQRGSIHFITSLSSFYNLIITWTFGCAGHGKGTWDGLGGIVKNKTGHYLKAFDSFISSAYEVFEIIHHLFASEEAQSRYDKMENLKIKSWTILWLSDDVIERRFAVKRVKGKKKNAITEGDDIVINAENEDTEDGESFGPLQAFHGVGTRGLFYFYAEHRDGLGVRLSGCHCPYCIRCFRSNGVGSMPSGCVSKEPYEYIICQRTDEEWVKQTSSLISNLVETLRKDVNEGDIVAIVNGKPQRGSITSTCDIYHIAQVKVVLETGYIVNIFDRKLNTSIFQCRILEQSITVPLTSLRYIVDKTYLAGSDVTLESDTNDHIIKNCFNGITCT